MVMVALRADAASLLDPAFQFRTLTTRALRHLLPSRRGSSCSPSRDHRRGRVATSRAGAWDHRATSHACDPGGSVRVGERLGDTPSLQSDFHHGRRPARVRFHRPDRRLVAACFHARVHTHRSPRSFGGLGACLAWRLRADIAHASEYLVAGLANRGVGGLGRERHHRRRPAARGRFSGDRARSGTKRTHRANRPRERRADGLASRACSLCVWTRLPRLSVAALRR